MSSISRNLSSIFNEPLGKVNERAAEQAKTIFSASSYKQLSTLQQKQVGLILGATVADAAVRPLEGLSPKHIEQIVINHDDMQTEQLLLMEKKKNKMKGLNTGTSFERGPSYMSYHPLNKPNTFSILDPCVFTSPTMVDEACVEDGDDSSVSAERSTLNDRAKQNAAVDLAAFRWLRSHHSYSYLFFHRYLLASSLNRHTISVDQIISHWLAIAEDHIDDHNIYHQRLSHICCALLMSASMAPWTDDSTLRRYNNPFLDLLTSRCETNNDRMEYKDPLLKGAAASFLSIPLRSLQHNPDAVRNSAFCALPQEEGGNVVFPMQYHEFVPHTAGSSTPPREVEVNILDQNILEQRHVVQTAVHIIASSRTFSEGVLKCSRAAHVPIYSPNKCGVSPLVPSQFLGPLAMLVGGCLGAKFGVRGIPLEWIKATKTGESVSGHAIEVATWSWNTPARSRR